MLRPVYRVGVEAPLRASGYVVEQDAEELRRLMLGLLKVAREKGAGVIGLSVYCGSVAAWRKSGEPLTNVVM